MALPSRLDPAASAADRLRRLGVALRQGLLLFASMHARFRWTANAAPWSVAALGIAVGLMAGLIFAPRGGGGLATYRSQNLWALVPTGWKNTDLPSPYGTALASWVDLQNPANSIAIRARAPAHPSPEARAFARARALGSETKSYVYEVQWPGGRTAWEVLYVDHKVHTALFEYDACSPAIAMTVTLNASGSSRLFDMEHTLPQGAEPVCDGSAFASPDRADVAVPLKLPASS